MTATYQRWTRADGKRMIRVQGVGRVASTLPGGPPHPLDGKPYWYDREDYPPHPMPARGGPQEAPSPVEPEVVVKSARWVDESSPNLPRGVQGYLNRARAAGWTCGLAAAQEAGGAHVLSLLAARPGQRVLLSWRWRPPRWTPETKSRPSRWIDTGSWSTTSALVGRAGRDGVIRFTKTTVTDGAKELG